MLKQIFLIEREFQNQVVEINVLMNLPLGYSLHLDRLLFGLDKRCIYLQYEQPSGKNH